MQCLFYAALSLIFSSQILSAWMVMLGRQSFKFQHNHPTFYCLQYWESGPRPKLAHMCYLQSSNDYCCMCWPAEQQELLLMYRLGALYRLQADFLFFPEPLKNSEKCALCLELFECSCTGLPLNWIKWTWLLLWNFELTWNNLISEIQKHQCHLLLLNVTVTECNTDYYIISPDWHQW